MGVRDGSPADVADDGTPPVPSPHLPVLLPEVLAALAPERGGLFLDGTFGAGGYTRALLERPNAQVVALDRDPRAVRDGATLVAQHGARLTLREARFGDLAKAASEPLAGVVLDVGVSSMQLDNADRGFSFRFDAPLDMRMEASGRTAADLLAELEQTELANVIYRFGEERASRRIARAIVNRRETDPVTTTGALAALVKSLLGQKFGEMHPATRTFQALRIAVNDELGELSRALVGAEQALAPGGRLAIVTFHSLEDRIVKQFLSARAGRGETRSRRLPGEPPVPEPTFELIRPQPIVPGEAEIARNPRARSAKLRAAIRRDGPARAMEGAKP